MDTVQGPFAASEDATVYIHIASYAAEGGSANRAGTIAEVSFMHIDNFLEVREFVLSVVKGRATLCIFRFRSTGKLCTSRGGKTDWVLLERLDRV